MLDVVGRAFIAAFQALSTDSRSSGWTTDRKLS
jgi:hypothetical protein